LQETFVISKSGQRIEIEALYKKIETFWNHAICALEEYLFQSKNGNFNIIRRTFIEYSVCSVQLLCSLSFDEGGISTININYYNY
jgi:hypothetical protein